MQCLCPAGKYLLTATSRQCINCPNDMYCERASDDNSAVKRYMKSCPANTVTLRPGAKSFLDCVNNQGYFFSNATALSKRRAAEMKAAVSNAAGPDTPALPCPPDTYSTGLKFQTKCTPCPPGLKDTS